MFLQMSDTYSNPNYPPIMYRCSFLSAVVVACFAALPGLCALSCKLYDRSRLRHITNFIPHICSHISEFNIQTNLKTELED